MAHSRALPPPVPRLPDYRRTAASRAEGAPMLRRRGPPADTGPCEHPLPGSGRRFGRRADRSPPPLRLARKADSQERRCRIHRLMAPDTRHPAPDMVRLRWSALPAMTFRLGQAVLLVAGAAAGLLLFLPWTPWAVGLALLAVAGIVWAYLHPRPATRDPRTAIAIAIVINCVTGLLVLLHAIYAMRPGLWDWTDWLITRRDYFFIWGFKARLFFVEHGIPW